MPIKEKCVWTKADSSQVRVFYGGSRLYSINLRSLYVCQEV